MNTSFYQLSNFEAYISKEYQCNGLYSASDMEIERIASIFNGEIRYTHYKSHVRWDDENKFFVIFLNQYSSEKQMRYQFFHELAHPLLHVANQTGDVPELLMKYQEEQAQHFQLYASLPIYILEEYNNEYTSPICVKFLSNEFMLPQHLVKRRLEQIYGRIHSVQYQRKIAEFNNSRYRISNPANWSQETKRILDKLQRQLKASKHKGAANE